MAGERQHQQDPRVQARTEREVLPLRCRLGQRMVVHREGCSQAATPVARRMGCRAVCETVSRLREVQVDGNGGVGVSVWPGGSPLSLCWLLLGWCTRQGPLTYHKDEWMVRCGCDGGDIVQMGKWGSGYLGEATRRHG